MRWKPWIGGLASVLALVGGCKQKVFMNQCDYYHYQDIMPAHLEQDACATAGPTVASVPTPSTINNPEREMRYISLAECIAISLEHGNVGNGLTAQVGALISNPNFTQFVASDTLVSFNGGQATGFTDAIRVLALDPATFGATVENSLSKFDAVWTSSMSWQNTDRPIGTPLDAFQAGNSGVNAIQQQDASFNTAILKPLPTGGVAGITFKTDYQLTNLPARVNPSYRPDLQFQFEQPLLQGFGVEINQLRAAHPGSILNPGVLNTQPTNSGILISRIQFDQERAEFERLVQVMAANVEFAYWNLYNAYWTLYAQEAAMRQAFEAWKIGTAKYQAGRSTIADLAQARGQYELFRVQRIQALDGVLEGERQLRAMLNLPAEDGQRLVPSDSPTLAPFNPDWHTAVEDALALRPELYIARQQVKSSQLQVALAKNQLLPDLRFTSTYDINAIGTRLDGADTSNAFRNLSSDHFNNWSLGLRLNYPIGYRSAYANLRIARLALARAYGVLQNNEDKVQRSLANAYREIFRYYEEIRANRAQREAFGDQLRARFEEFRAGRGTLDLLLEAQRFWAQALAAEYASIAQYNKQLAFFEYEKGTILQHDNILISEGALPECAQIRAVEHEKERTKALVLCERAQPVEHTPFKEDGAACLPKLPEDKAPSLPSLMEKAPALPSPEKAPKRSKLEEASPSIPVDGAETSGQPLIGPGRMPAAMPLQLPPAKPAKPKADPKKPSDFGALRPVSENKTDVKTPDVPVNSTGPMNGAQPQQLKSSAVDPARPQPSAPMLPPSDLPSLSTTPLPPLSTK